VTNAIKHGKAKSIEIRLTAEKERIILSIRDDGCGLTTTAGNGKGMGLRIMQYRAGLIGAKALLQPQARGGLALICQLPQSANAAHAS